MDKAYNDKRCDAHSRAQHQEQTDMNELLAYQSWIPSPLSSVAGILSTQQANLERQIGEYNAGRAAMSFSDGKDLGRAQGTTKREESIFAWPENFGLFVIRMAQNRQCEHDTGYETQSFLSDTTGSDVAPSTVSEYGTAMEWPLRQHQEPLRAIRGESWKESQQRPQQSEQFQRVVDNIIEAHYGIVETQAANNDRLKRIIEQLDSEFRQFAEEEQIKIRDATNRSDHLSRMLTTTISKLRRAEERINSKDLRAEQIKQLNSNLEDANNEVQRLKDGLQQKEQELASTWRTVTSSNKMYACAIELKERLQAKVGRGDATIALLRDRVHTQGDEIASLNNQLEAWVDEYNLMKKHRNRCIEMSEQSMRTFERL